MDFLDRQNQGARFLFIAASFVVVIAGMRAASSVILPFLVAIFLAMISLPLLNWLQGRRVPKWLALLITLVVLIGLVIAIVALVGNSIKEFTDAAPRYRAKLTAMSSNLLAWLQERGVRVSGEMIGDWFDPGRTFDLVSGTLLGVTAVLSNVFLVFLTIGFILLEAAGFQAKLRAAFGWQEGSERSARIRSEVQRYLAFKTLVSLATGSVIGAATAVIGVDFPLLWGGLAFLLNYVPNLGSIIAAIPPTLLALVQLGPGHALAVMLVFVAVNVTLGNIVEPRLMGRKLGLSTLVVFLSLVFWGWVWGPIGMLLSVPLTMILKIMLENTEDLRWVAVLLDDNPQPIERPARAGGSGKR
jgi:predicted PurR-regulated permease PerM